MSGIFGLLFRRISDRNIILEPKLVIALNFLSCLGQLVEIFNELQFWIDTEILASMVARGRIAAATTFC